MERKKKNVKTKQEKLFFIVLAEKRRWGNLVT